MKFRWGGWSGSYKVIIKSRSKGSARGEVKMVNGPREQAARRASNFDATCRRSELLASKPAPMTMLIRRLSSGLIDSRMEAATRGPKQAGFIAVTHIINLIWFETVCSGAAACDCPSRLFARGNATPRRPPADALAASELCAVRFPNRASFRFTFSRV